MVLRDLNARLAAAANPRTVFLAELEKMNQEMAEERRKVTETRGGQSAAEKSTHNARVSG